MRETDEVNLVTSTNDDLQVVVANDGACHAFIIESNVAPTEKVETAFVTIGEDIPYVTPDTISRVEIVSSGSQGPPGAQGKPGPAGGTSLTLAAGETIFGLRAVQAQGGTVYNADTSDTDLIFGSVAGIALQSVVLGEEVEVQVAGELTEPSWNWAPGYVYCGPDGSLTQSTGGTGWLLIVGRVVDPTTIIVDIGQLFIRI